MILHWPRQLACFTQLAIKEPKSSQVVKFLSAKLDISMGRGSLGHVLHLRQRNPSLRLVDTVSIVLNQNVGSAQQRLGQGLETNGISSNTVIRCNNHNGTFIFDHAHPYHYMISSPISSLIMWLIKSMHLKSSDQHDS